MYELAHFTRQLKSTIHNTARDFSHNKRGAMELLAVQMENEGFPMSSQILSNKACDTNESHHFRPEQLLAFQALTDDWSITDCFVEARKRLSKKYATANGEKGVHASMLSITEEFGQVAHAIGQALADNKITETERRRCLNELDDVFAACEQLKSALHQAGIDKSVSVVR